MEKDNLRHGFYLTTGRDSKGKFVAICSDGTPQRGHEHVTILSLEVVKDEAEAKAWFKRVIVERPWETRQ